MRFRKLDGLIPLLLKIFDECDDLFSIGCNLPKSDEEKRPL